MSKRYQKEKFRKSWLKKCSTLVLLLGLSTGFVPMAMADITDTATDLSQIVEFLASIVAATQISAEELQLIEPETKAIQNSTSNIDTSTASIDETTDEHWKAMQKEYDMAEPTGASMSFEQGGSGYTELWTEDEWDKALDSAAGGNNERYAQLKESYEENNPTLLNHDVGTIDTKKLVDTGYTKRAETNSMALAASQYTYEDVNQRIRNLQKLMEMIDQPDKNKNEKAAIDLNSRLVAEVGLIQVEMLRLQSIQAQVQASEQQDVINHETIEKQMLGLSVEKQTNE